MTFNLSNLGVEWRNEDLGLTLWMHPSTYFGKRNIVEKALNRFLPYDTTAEESGNHSVNNWRNAFLFVEAYILRYECDNEDLPLVQYLKARSKMDFEGNFELFQLLAYTDVMFIFDAFTDTRPADVVSDVDDEKKSNSG